MMKSTKKTQQAMRYAQDILVGCGVVFPYTNDSTMTTDPDGVERGPPALVRRDPPRGSAGVRGIDAHRR